MTHKNLQEFIRAHVGHALAGDPNMVDMAIIKLAITGTPNAGELRAHLKAHVGVFGDPMLDLLDGREHGYIEIGGWIGDQGAALCLMALGKHLELWELLTPMLMLGIKSDDTMAQTMAGAGYLSIIAKRVPA